MKAKENFTWLPYKIDIEFEGILIQTLPKFDKIIKSIKEQVNSDGFIYPPIVEMHNKYSLNQESIPNSTREAPFYTLSPTHTIEVDKLATKKGNAQLLELVVNYIGFVYGYRAHIISKPFDRRIYLKSNADHSIPSLEWLTESLKKLIDFWDELSEKNKKTLNNLLFLHSRAPIYEYTWERFLLEYQVFDSLWRIGKDIKLYLGGNHSERITIVCTKFNMMIDESLIKSIVDLRNDLFHQSLWDKNTLDYDSHRTVTQCLYLDKLNQRFLFALLGYTGGYITMPWNAHVFHSFVLN